MAGKIFDHPFDTLSAAQREAAHAALAATFGTTPMTTIVAIAGGASGASTFRVETGGRRYMLRIEGQASPLRNPQWTVQARHDRDQARVGKDVSRLIPHG